MRMNLDHVASGGETFIASSIIGHSAVNMPPAKVCPQCKAAVPVRWKTCERCDHVFRSKRKAECNLGEKAMKSARNGNCSSVALKSRMGKWEIFFPSPFQILVMTNSGTFLGTLLQVSTA